MWYPFVGMGLGFLIGYFFWRPWLHRVVDRSLNISLAFVIFALGGKLGANQELIGSLGTIGWQSLVLLVLATAGSVGLLAVFEFGFLLRGTALPVHSQRDGFAEPPAGPEVTGAGWARDKNSAAPPILDGAGAGPESGRVHHTLTVVIMASLIGGIALGRWVLPGDIVAHLGLVITIALGLLYVGVGVSFGHNKQIWAYLRQIGWIALMIPVVALAGSLLGGWAAAYLIDTPVHTTLAVAGGMGYYSLSAVIVAELSGVRDGTLAFLSNLMRELVTFVLTPVLLRVSSLGPIGVGGATTMDTTLGPIVRLMGTEFGILAVINGSVLTILVPLVVPLLLGLH